MIIIRKKKTFVIEKCISDKNSSVKNLCIIKNTNLKEIQTKMDCMNEFGRFDFYMKL